MVNLHRSRAPDPDSEPEEENKVHMSPETINHNMWIAGVFYDCRSMVHTMLFFLIGWITGGNQNKLVADQSDMVYDCDAPVDCDITEESNVKKLGKLKPTWIGPPFGRGVMDEGAVGDRTESVKAFSLKRTPDFASKFENPRSKTPR